MDLILFYVEVGQPTTIIPHKAYILATDASDAVKQFHEFLREKQYRYTRFVSTRVVAVSGGDRNSEPDLPPILVPFS